MDGQTTAAAAQQVGHRRNLAVAIVGGIIGTLAGLVPGWVLARRQSAEMLSSDKAA